MEITESQVENIRRATDDFSKAMEIRSSTNIRVARRVTAILRIGMVSFGAVTLILVLMLYAFTSKMDEMIVALNTMSRQFSSMSEDMTLIRSTLYTMEQNIAYVPAIMLTTSDISTSVSEIRNEIESIEISVANLNNEVYGITNQVDGMTANMNFLDPAVRHIGRDVYRMSGPMRLFNRINPVD